jgi:tetratricopeptide (TPR) repeat protein
MFAGIGVAVIVVAGGAGVAVRMWQNKHSSDTASTTFAGTSLPKAVSDAQDLRLNGDTAAADKKIDDALNDSKTSKDDRYLLLIQKAAGAYDQQNYNGAIDAYSQAVQTKQTSEAYELLGDSYAAAGQKDKAIEAYKNAIPLVPNSPVQDDDKAALENKIHNLGGSV